MPIKPYDHTTYPANGAAGSSSALRNELDAIEAGFDMVATEIETALTGALGAATTATTKAAEALTSANNADISEAAAAASAAAALVSQGAAATSETNAAASALAVANTYDDFDDRYLGAKSVAPTLDNDGNALQVGTLYWDSALVTLRGYNGAAWVSLPATSANNITNTPSGNLAATDVQAALNELQTDIDTRALNSALTTTNSNLTNHLNDTADSHDASAISYAGNTNLSATDVEAALDELDNEKLSNAAGAVTNAKLAFDGGALGYRNILINAGFRINQRAYVSAAVLAAGAYAHDRWKAGASGGNYSFTQLNTNTQITIAAGKSLIQVVEDKNVHETAYVLSWTGTSQARVGVNSDTPSGAYAASPILITGQTVGTTMSVEFNEGTLGKAQLEAGATATPFENRYISTELALCQRYFKAAKAQLSVYALAGNGTSYRYSTTPMRATPTVESASYTGISNSSAHSIAATANDSVAFSMSVTAAGNGSAIASCFLNAEL